VPIGILGAKEYIIISWRGLEKGKTGRRKAYKKKPFDRETGRGVKKDVFNKRGKKGIKDLS